MRTLVYVLTMAVTLVVILVGLLSFYGWKHWVARRGVPRERSWRSAFNAIGLALVSLSVLLFVAYAVHNIAVGGDRNLNAATVPWIKTGNSLSFLGALISLSGKGKGRWPSVVAGCLMLVLWIAEGISL